MDNLAVKKLKEMVTLSNQKTVAEELGISPAYLCDILAGKSGVSDRMAAKLGLRWMLIEDDPALEEYLHKFKRAPKEDPK